MFLIVNLLVKQINKEFLLLFVSVSLNFSSIRPYFLVVVVSLRLLFLINPRYHLIGNFVSSNTKQIASTPSITAEKKCAGYYCSLTKEEEEIDNFIIKKIIFVV